MIQPSTFSGCFSGIKIPISTISSNFLSVKLPFIINLQDISRSILLNQFTNAVNSKRHASCKSIRYQTVILLQIQNQGH